MKVCTSPADKNIDCSTAWKGRVLFPALLSVLFVCSALFGSQRVLALHSYHKADWSDSVQAGFISALSSRRDIELRTEYMDTKWLESPEYLEELRTLYRMKYAGTQFSGILASDDIAFHFALANRDSLFGGAPVSFCGVNRFDPRTVAGLSGIAGVLEEAEFKGTLDLLADLLPESKVLHVVGDSTETGLGNLAEFQNCLSGYGSRWAVCYHVGESFDSLASHLRVLPKSDAVLFISFWRDACGRRLTPDDIAPLFLQSAAPVFGRSEWMLGRGMLGGRCVSGRLQGEEAGRLLLHLLAQPHKPPHIENSPNPLIVDAAEALRHAVDISRIPAGAVVLNRPVSIIERYSRILLLFLSTVGILFAIILLLLNSLRRRRRAERALASEHQRLDVTLRSIGDAVVTVDLSGCIQTMNPVAEKLCGWEEAEVAGHPLAEVFHIVDSASGLPVDSPVAEALAKGIVTEMGTRAELISKSGTRHRVADSAAPIRTQNGPIMGAILVFRDITEQVHVEDLLRQSQKMEVVGQLAGGIAHDFNNMLGGMMGFADVLLMRLSGKDEEGAVYAREILSTGERAASLVRKLLDFSRRGKNQSMPVDLHSIILQSMSILERSIDRNITLDCNPPERICVVDGDPAQLVNAFLNLGINARDAMPAGGVFSIVMDTFPASSPEALPEGDYVRVRVKDTGVGMPQEVQERVFEPFFTTKDVGKGTGMGLPAVYGCVKDHGGAITVESMPGQGTEFTLWFPLSDEPLRSGPAVPLVSRSSGCVLVVDDEPVVRSMSMAILASLGYECLAAADGIEALDLYRRESGRISVVLLDMVMPVMGGREVLEQLRAINPQLPIVLSSGFPQERIAAGGLRLADCIFVQKPYRIADLSDALHRACGISSC